MEFAMDIDMNPRKRVRDEDAPLADTESHVAKRTRQTEADAVALASATTVAVAPLDAEFQPSTPGDSTPTTPAAMQVDDDASSTTSSTTSRATTPDPERLRRYQRYLRQGYPLSWFQ